MGEELAVGESAIDNRQSTEGNAVEGAAIQGNNRAAVDLEPSEQIA